MLSIPAGQVAAGHLPHICARHGEPPVEMKRIRFVSKPPPWAAVLILAGGIIYLIVVSVLRKKIEAPAWAWCAQCKAQRSRMLGIGLGVLAVGLLLIVVGIATIDSSAGPLLFFVGLLGLLAGAIVAARSNYQVVTSAFVSQDGQFLEVHKEDPRFVQALRQGQAPPQPAWGQGAGQPQPQQQWGYGSAPQQAVYGNAPRQAVYGNAPVQSQPGYGTNPQPPSRY
jgi:disulfide bond formation protein DsbB